MFSPFAGSSITFLKAADMEHTKEPWSVFNDCVESSDGKVIAHVLTSQYDMESLTSIDASRIVACVNACVGIPTEHLEKGPNTVEQLAQLAEAEIDKLEQQRDELLAALKRSVSYVRAAGVLIDLGDDLKIIEAAIAKVEAAK